MIIVRLLFQTVVLAIGQIWANKVRAMLTCLGVIIGVASIIAVVGSLTGLERFVLAEFEKIGAKRVFIDGDRPPSMRHKVSWREVQLSQEEVELIRDNCPSISAIAPEWRWSCEVVSGEYTVEGVSVVGIWPAWHDITGREVLTGRPFSRIDEEERLLVCLVNERAIEQLNLPRDPTGMFILMGGRRVKIVGVVDTIQSGMFGGGDTPPEFFMPFATCRWVLNPDGWLNMAWGELKSPELAEDAKAEINHVLRQSRGLDPEDENTWEVGVIQQFIDQFNRVAAAITAGAGGVVGISLLVGGIGIMNIMLVSVSERTREIGLRKALGAQPAVILVQFLVEAVVLCLTGAAIGLAIGFALIFGVRAIPDSPLEAATAPMWAIALSVGFSVATGVIFGMFPALKAARLNPIEALRHE